MHSSSICALFGFPSEDSLRLSLMNHSTCVPQVA